MMCTVTTLPPYHKHAVGFDTNICWYSYRVTVQWHARCWQQTTDTEMQVLVVENFQIKYYPTVNEYFSINAVW
ncbi:hypothetical protein EB796_016068 [Bugula neritina]|uniref:Uncharacterized protein n=1 Tax=Bugula neritina TaxID=10212 RepID=A0A7J7JIH1_BUGNE|nr:hypothetical protein EB796_016068 [Bugula neritina]